MPDTTKTYIIGETLRATVTVSFDGTPTDPTTITAVAISPEGTSAAATVTDETGTGNYSASYTPSAGGKTGRWRLRITAVHSGNTEIEDVVFRVGE